MTNDSKNIRCAINYLEELKCHTSGYAVEWLDMAIRALNVIQGEEAFWQALPVLDMRDATEEERSSLKRYIDSISKSTGVKFDFNGVKTELEPCDDCISRETALNGLIATDLKGWQLAVALEVMEKLPSVKPQNLEQIKWERDTAIEQLEQLGYGLGAKIEPYDDCVSRQAATEVIYDEYYDNAIAHDIVGMLFDLPPAKPQRPQGKWIEQNDTSKHHFGWYYCSNCGAYLMSADGVNYCSCCGAEMEDSND